ncbi:MAG TPA: XdhC/CoxI family protein [Anaerolineae bacterium]
MNIYEELKQNLVDEELCAVATVVSGARDIGAKLLVYPDGRTVGGLGRAELDAQVVPDAQSLMAQEKAENRTYGETEVFIEVFAPRPKLVIFGGVHTAIPLTQFAQALGFRVTIVDGRARFATRERFPTADAIVVAWPEEALAQLKIDSSTYIAILTHDPKFDIPALEALSKSRPRYIGSMGSRETRRQHFEELRSRGVQDEFLDTVHGPIGLDLGARSPEEMALAVMAEIVAVRYGRTGSFMSDGKGD